MKTTPAVQSTLIHTSSHPERKDRTLMATNKQTTKAKTTGQRQDSAAEIAGHISAILAHPATPTPLFNAIAEALTSMSSDMDYHTVDMIERTLVAFKGDE